MTTDPLGGEITVRCQQIGHTLLKDVIPSYSKVIGDGYNPSDILADFLTYQEYERVVFGGVSVSLDFPIAIDITWLNIWEACKIVRDTAGGYLYVDFNPDNPLQRRIWLTDSIGKNKGQQIRLGKNLTGVSYAKDYIEYANRLYPVGNSNLLLSTIDFVDSDVIATADATYGYLTLLEKHGAYKDWTGEGDALPGHITVGKPIGAWVNPTGFSGSIGWTNPANAYDDNTATYAQWMPFTYQTWTNYLELTIAATATHQIKFPGYYTSGSIPGACYYSRIQVDIYYGAAWHNIYDAIPTGYEMGDFLTATFGEQTITSVRIRYFNTSDTSIWATSCLVSEVYIWDGDAFADDSANWVQGENEATLRCDIGDYTADIGYVVSYTHADYLIDLTNVTGRDDIYSKTLSFETDDIDTLIAQARVKLDEILVPIINIDTNLVDLSIKDGQEYEQLELGNQVTIIDEGIGIEYKTNVVRISKPDLLQSGMITVELSSKIKDIIDVL